MKLFLYFTNNANVMTQQLLLATFMQPNSVIHQPKDKRCKSYLRKQIERVTSTSTMTHNTAITTYISTLGDSSVSKRTNTS